MADKDQLFSNMHRVAIEWLSGHSPINISSRTNLPFYDNAFHLISLGQEITIIYPSYQIRPLLNHWHILTILHYLSSADGTPLSGKLISFSHHKDGIIRGDVFDRNVEKIIATKLGCLSDEELKKRIRALGGELFPSNADLCAKFSYLPNYPVYLKIWFADDEFPASGRMLLDSSAEHYLSLEDAVTIGELILDKLCNPN